jgi:transcriptional regulator with XRE-family HTH domain
MQRVGLHLREARLLRGWSQKTLGARAQCSEVTVNRIERGRAPYIGFWAIARLTRALDLSMDAVLQLDQVPLVPAPPTAQTAALVCQARVPEERQACLALATAQGYTVSPPYHYLMPYRRIDSPAWDALYDVVTTQQVRAVIFYTIDRTPRMLAAFVMLRLVIRTSGAKLYCVTFPQITEHPETDATLARYVCARRGHHATYLAHLRSTRQTMSNNPRQKESIWPNAE